MGHDDSFDPSMNPRERRVGQTEVLREIREARKESAKRAETQQEHGQTLVRIEGDIKSMGKDLHRGHEKMADHETRLRDVEKTSVLSDERVRVLRKEARHSGGVTGIAGGGIVSFLWRAVEWLFTRGG